MKAMIPILVILLLGGGAAMLFVIVPWATRALEVSRRHRQRVQAEERADQMARYLDARPTRATRQNALEQVMEAWVDERITLIEHGDLVEAIEAAVTNRQVEAVVNRIAVVEKPE